MISVIGPNVLLGGKSPTKILAFCIFPGPSQLQRHPTLKFCKYCSVPRAKSVGTPCAGFKNFLTGLSLKAVNWAFLCFITSAISILFIYIMIKYLLLNCVEKKVLKKSSGK